jgi:hypothetical protein
MGSQQGRAMLERETVKYKFKLTAVAFANKVARIVFVLMTRGGSSPHHSNALVVAPAPHATQMPRVQDAMSGRRPVVKRALKVL